MPKKRFNSTILWTNCTRKIKMNSKINEKNKYEMQRHSFFIFCALQSYSHLLRSNLLILTNLPPDKGHATTTCMKFSPSYVSYLQAKAARSLRELSPWRMCPLPKESPAAATKATGQAWTGWAPQLFAPCWNHQLLPSLAYELWYSNVLQLQGCSVAGLLSPVSSRRITGWVG